MAHQKTNKETYTEFLLDQLSGLSGISAKKMFGGVGFFKEGMMFGMVDGSGGFLLRVDESNQPDYQNAGMKSLQSPSKKGSMPYWTVPVEVVEDREQLVTWAGNAYQVALKHKKK